jgi:hypothetical protein
VLLPSARASLVKGFTEAARSGAAVGQGNSSSFKAPAGVPQSVVAEIGRIAREAFSYGYVSAMHQTLIMPIAVLGVTALSCLAIKRVPNTRRQADAEKPASPQPEASQTPA